ncbi:hydroxyacid dehydrogenase [Streptomyces sp. N2-109]|uniref:Hydroxyacid dehydrogenase n=1 Tax=Streptomyces gossypii TaxID=2883101 RepID=A0ABT2JYF1_9ACTN|nr:hydroxyacid dehydrogenase [Streptomyces gossypii]MCT2592861.1 hydroxyacid dehydrogenase [Streptomyces gossypii]
MPERRRPTALFAMSPEHLPRLFPPDVRARLDASADADPTAVADNFDTPRSREALSAASVLITGWGCPPLDASVLETAPRLRAVLHTGGSVKGLVSPACWERGLAISSAADANAVPVAEYTLAMILLAGKDTFALRERYGAERHFTLGLIHGGIGNRGRRVGVIGASRIGRRVLELLRPFDVEAVLCDPYTDDATAARLGARRTGLEELLGTCDTVSVHAPETPETLRMLNAERLALMRDGTVLINTARGALVDTPALTRELLTGRLTAVLDVTEPEPLPADSPLFELPNVVLTPHIAGSHGNELHRLGLSVVQELERLSAGQPLAHRVHAPDLHRVA